MTLSFRLIFRGEVIKPRVRPMSPTIVMQESVSDHINHALDCLVRVVNMLDKLKSPHSSELLDITTDVMDGIAHLRKASEASFEKHVHLALSPGCFNPFNLLEVHRAYSRFSIHDEARTVMHLEDVVDYDHDEEEKSPSERMKQLVSRTPVHLRSLN